MKSSGYFPLALAEAISLSVMTSWVPLDGERVLLSSHMKTYSTQNMLELIRSGVLCFRVG